MIESRELKPKKCKNMFLSIRNELVCLKRGFELCDFNGYQSTNCKRYNYTYSKYAKPTNMYNILRKA